MNRKIYALSAACLLSSVLFGNVAAKDKQSLNPEVLSLLNLNDIKVTHKDSTLDISFDINSANINPGIDRQVVFTPVIKSQESTAADSLILESLTIAGRNRYYSHLRNGDIEDGEAIYQAGKKV